MRFNSTELFKDTVNRYAAVSRYSIRWTKSYKMQKLATKCKKGCPWYVYASWSGDKTCFVVKSVKPTHHCNRQDFENRQCRPKWLAREFMMQYKLDPNWPKKALAKAVMEKFGVRLESWACYRVKREAHRPLHGSLQHHYMKVGSYLKELLKNDPDTLVEVATVNPENEGEPPVFQRRYMSLSGLRKGFLNGCRPVLCVDGCFLKTFLRGQLLVAVARDGNNQMFPVSWAVVESEDNDSWHWFLFNLKKDLNGFEAEAVATLFPNVEHRLCARHPFSNWTKKHKGPGFKNAFYKVVKATNMSAYEIALQELRVLSQDAATDLVNEQPKRFCRAFFRTFNKCELVVNNLA
ncbi:Heat shock 70 kDa protein 6 [Bienertia sinuspersici]